MRRAVPLLFLCAACGLIAYICLDFWSSQNAPLYRRFERQWAEDVGQLEDSHKLPAPWFDVGKIELYGGTPESKEWLQLIHVPLIEKKDGHYKLEVLVVAWEEDGKRGVTVQYDLVDLKSGNNIWELGRTFILSRPQLSNPLENLIQEFKHI